MKSNLNTNPGITMREKILKKPQRKELKHPQPGNFPCLQTQHKAAFKVVDVWDALTSDRSYRDAWSKEKVIEYIRSESGKHFDPRVVDTFLAFILRE